MSYRDQLYFVAQDYLESQGWNYDKQPEKYLYSFSMRLKSKLKSCKVWIDVKEGTILCQAVCPLNADEADRPKVAEFITRANYGLLYGNFEMDYRDGEVRYKTTLSCKTVLPDMKDVERTVDMGFLMMDRYGDGLAMLMMGFGEPEELIKKIENN